MESNKHIKSAIESWYEEKRSAYLYRIVAQHEKNHESKLFSQLAEEADAQAKMWAANIHQLGGETPQSFTPNIRTRLVGWLVKRFGAKKLRTILAAMKVRGMSVYLQNQPTPHHPMPTSIDEIGHGHRTFGSSNNIRAAVFGINDGLVSNVSLILGLVGAHADNRIIILAGIAGLLAGAFSMGAGEYISVRSQREMFEYQIGLEKQELALYPKEETEELALIYQARGLPMEQARQVAAVMMQDPENALNTLAREELGLNPDDLVSPYGAAIASFVSFTIGAAIPVIPFFFNQYIYTVPASIIATGISLFTVGAILSLYTGRHALRSGLRMLLIGAGAGIITFAIGHLLGVTLG